MTVKRRLAARLGIAALAVAMLAAASAQASDPLPSWNDGKTKQGIVELVEGVTRDGGPHHVPCEARIATFDNGGTLWVEHRMKPLTGRETARWRSI